MHRKSTTAKLLDELEELSYIGGKYCVGPAIEALSGDKESESILERRVNFCDELIRRTDKLCETVHQVNPLITVTEKLDNLVNTAAVTGLCSHIMSEYDGNESQCDSLRDEIKNARKECEEVINHHMKP